MVGGAILPVSRKHTSLACSKLSRLGSFGRFDRFRGVERPVPKKTGSASSPSAWNGSFRWRSRRFLPLLTSELILYCPQIDLQRKGETRRYNFRKESSW